MSCNSGCIGRMDRKVTIQSLSITKTGMRTAKTWTDWKTDLATKIKTSSGTEKGMAEKETAIDKRVYIFRTKSITGLEYEMKIIDGSNEFDIEHIAPFGREKYMEVVAKMRK